MKLLCNDVFITLRGYTMGLLFILIIGSSIAEAQHDHRKVDELFEAMDLKEGSWVADIGSREGYYSIRMAPRVGATGHVFAVDINENSLEELHENIKRRNIDNITPVFSIHESPMLPANSLDAILVRNAYHEFIDYMEMLRQIRKSLKPGGRLVLADAYDEDTMNMPREDQVDDHDIALHYARKEVQEAGFRIIKEDPEFTEKSDRSGRGYWLIIAVPNK